MRSYFGCRVPTRPKPPLITRPLGPAPLTLTKLKPLNPYGRSNGLVLAIPEILVIPVVAGNRERDWALGAIGGVASRLVPTSSDGSDNRDQEMDLNQFNLLNQLCMEDP